VTLPEQQQMQNSAGSQRRMQPAECLPRHRPAQEKTRQAPAAASQALQKARCCADCHSAAVVGAQDAGARQEAQQGQDYLHQCQGALVRTAQSSMRTQPEAAGRFACSLAQQQQHSVRLVPHCHCSRAALSLSVCLPTAMRSCSRVCPTPCGCRASWLVGSSCVQLAR
jgi:hypothetical protein